MRKPYAIVCTGLVLANSAALAQWPTSQQSASLTDADREAIQHTCDIRQPLRYDFSGPEHQACLDQYSSSAEMITLARFSVADQDAIDLACLNEKSKGGPAFYRRCVAEKIHDATYGVPTVFDRIRTAWDWVVFNWPVALAALVLLLGLCLRARRKPVAQHAPIAAPPALHPYLSEAALIDFTEAKAHGSSDFAKAIELHASLSGAESHGRQPKFEE